MDGEGLGGVAWCVGMGWGVGWDGVGSGVFRRGVGLWDGGGSENPWAGELFLGNVADTDGDVFGGLGGAEGGNEFGGDVFYAEREAGSAFPEKLPAVKVGLGGGTVRARTLDGHWVIGIIWELGPSGCDGGSAACGTDWSKDGGGAGEGGGGKKGERVVIAEVKGEFKVEVVAGEGAGYAESIFPEDQASGGVPCGAGFVGEVVPAKLLVFEAEVELAESWVGAFDGYFSFTNERSGAALGEVEAAEVSGD
ncbi:hypothetical protein LCGC14_1088940 [marine sediment metagenome]|uniref:Uncharacterized protein n=1 Tax=marine sediment metagenome TaxID=412755 RepID=A0A0F9MD78_9ZZZZ